MSIEHCVKVYQSRSTNGSFDRKPAPPRCLPDGKPNLVAYPPIHGRNVAFLVACFAVVVLYFGAIASIGG